MKSDKSQQIIDYQSQSELMVAIGRLAASYRAVVLLVDQRVWSLWSHLWGCDKSHGNAQPGESDSLQKGCLRGSSGGYAQ